MWGWWDTRVGGAARDGLKRDLLGRAGDDAARVQRAAFRGRALQAALQLRHRDSDDGSEPVGGDGRRGGEPGSGEFARGQCESRARVERGEIC